MGKYAKVAQQERLDEWKTAQTDAKDDLEKFERQKKETSVSMVKMEEDLKAKEQTLATAELDYATQQKVKRGTAIAKTLSQWQAIEAENFLPPEPPLEAQTKETSTKADLMNAEKEWKAAKVNLENAQKGIFPTDWDLKKLRGEIRGTEMSLQKYEMQNKFNPTEGLEKLIHEDEIKLADQKAQEKKFASGQKVEIFEKDLQNKTDALVSAKATSKAATDDLQATKDLPYVPKNVKVDADASASTPAAMKIVNPAESSAEADQLSPTMQSDVPCKGNGTHACVGIEKTPVVSASDKMIAAGEQVEVWGDKTTDALEDLAAGEGDTAKVELKQAKEGEKQAEAAMDAAQKEVLNENPANVMSEAEEAQKKVDEGVPKALADALASRDAAQVALAKEQQLNENAVVGVVKATEKVEVTNAFDTHVKAEEKAGKKEKADKTARQIKEKAHKSAQELSTKKELTTKKEKGVKDAAAESHTKAVKQAAENKYKADFLAHKQATEEKQHKKDIAEASPTAAAAKESTARTAVEVADAEVKEVEEKIEKLKGEVKEWANDKDRQKPVTEQLTQLMPKLAKDKSKLADARQSEAQAEGLVDIAREKQTKLVAKEAAKESAEAENIDQAAKSAKHNLETLNEKSETAESSLRKAIQAEASATTPAAKIAAKVELQNAQAELADMRKEVQKEDELSESLGEKDQKAKEKVRREEQRAVKVKEYNAKKSKKEQAERAEKDEVNQETKAKAAAQKAKVDNMQKKPTNRHRSCQPRRS